MGKQGEKCRIRKCTRAFRMHVFSHCLSNFWRIVPTSNREHWTQFLWFAIACNTSSIVSCSPASIKQQSQQNYIAALYNIVDSSQLNPGHISIIIKRPRHGASRVAGLNPAQQSLMRRANVEWMQPLNPFLSAFFKSALPAQCTPVHHHVRKRASPCFNAVDWYGA